MEHVVNKEKSSVVPAPGEQVAVFTYLACLGPQAFAPEKAIPSLSITDDDPRRGWVCELLDPARRRNIGAQIGTNMAVTLASRGRGSTTDVGELLPALVTVDTELGYDVLANLAAAATPTLAREFSEILLSLTLAEGRVANSTTDAGTSRLKILKRLRYLVSVLSALELDTSTRGRLFLALSQTLDSPEIMKDVVLSAIFPAESTVGMSVLTDGNDDAIRALLIGAANRPMGKAEFYGACRSVMDLGLKAGLPTLAKVDRLLQGPESGLRAMASMVRASCLLALERAVLRNKELSAQLPDSPDIATLRLLTVVAPGVKEPTRSALSEWLLAKATRLLAAGEIVDSDVDSFVEVVIGATVLHSEPESASATVRKMFLDVAGSLRIALGRSRTPSSAITETANAFGRIVNRVQTEFKRRRHLAETLSSVLPIVTIMAEDDVSRFVRTTQQSLFLE